VNAARKLLTEVVCWKQLLVRTSSPSIDTSEQHCCNFIAHKFCSVRAFERLSHTQLSLYIDDAHLEFCSD